MPSESGWCLDDLARPLMDMMDAMAGDQCAICQ